MKPKLIKFSNPKVGVKKPIRKNIFRQFILCREMVEAGFLMAYRQHIATKMSRFINKLEFANGGVAQSPESDQEYIINK